MLLERTALSHLLSN